MLLFTSPTHVHFGVVGVLSHLTHYVSTTIEHLVSFNIEYMLGRSAEKHNGQISTGPGKRAEALEIADRTMSLPGLTV